MGLCGLSLARGRTVNTRLWELAPAITAHTRFPLISDSASNKPGAQPWASGPPRFTPLQPLDKCKLSFIQAV